MNLDLDKSAWKRVAFGDVVKNVNVTVKTPESEGISRVIAMEHLDPGELKVGRWGDLADGTTFTRRVRPGQTLFGKRRAYQRKAAYADFDAICSGDILVFEADGTHMLREFLPFLVQSDGFYNHALGTSAGSLSPRTNWRDLSDYEFDLPPIDEQERIAGILWAADRHHRALTAEQRVLADAAAVWSELTLDRLGTDMAIRDVVSSSRPICYGVVQPGQECESGIPLLRVLDLEGDGPRMERLKRVSEAVDRQYRRSRVRAGDVLVSIVGTIGRCWAVESEFEGANIARALARLAPDPDIDRSEYLLWVLASPRYQGILTTAAFESARKTLNLSALADLRIPVPSLSEQEQLIEQHVKSREALNLLRREREEVRGFQGALLREVGDVA